MMRYQVRQWSTKINLEFDRETDALNWAESLQRQNSGAVELIHWYVSRNLPNCKPDWRYKSCALKYLEDGWWRECNIFG